MKELFILNKTESYTDRDPKWRSIGTKEEGECPFLVWEGQEIMLVGDYRIRIPLVRKYE